VREWAGRYRGFWSWTNVDVGHVTKTREVAVQACPVSPCSDDDGDRVQICRRDCQALGTPSLPLSAWSGASLGSVEDGGLQFLAAVGCVVGRSRRDGRRPQSVADDAEKVGRDRCTDGDVLVAGRDDPVVGTIDRLWHPHSEEVEVFARALLEIGDAASVRAKNLSRLGSCLVFVTTTCRAGDEGDDGHRDDEGVGGAGFHDLRHTGQTLAAATGATLADLMKRLGHSSPAAAMHYLHTVNGRDEAIAEALSAIAEYGDAASCRRP
jgi:hypothetical protein